MTAVGLVQRSQYHLVYRSRADRPPGPEVLPGLVDRGSQPLAPESPSCRDLQLRGLDKTNAERLEDRGRDRPDPVDLLARQDREGPTGADVATLVAGEDEEV